jgi:hypothetical protein
MRFARLTIAAMAATAVAPLAVVVAAPAHAAIADCAENIKLAQDRNSIAVGADLAGRNEDAASYNVATQMIIHHTTFSNRCNSAVDAYLNLAYTNADIARAANRNYANPNFELALDAKAAVNENLEDALAANSQ